MADITMERYKTHSPTVFDAEGLNADSLGIGEWYVFPASQNRDSGPLERSNFAQALEGLGGESATVEVHRFGHWGPGWYEIIVIDPRDTARVEEAQEMADSLADYPVLDEEDFSRLEWEEATEYWSQMSLCERVRAIGEANEHIGPSGRRVNVFAARRDEIPEDPGGRLFERLTRD